MAVFKPMPKPIPSVTVKTYAGKGPHPPIKPRIKPRPLPPPTPRRKPTPLPPSPLAVSELPKGEQAIAYAGGFSTTAEGVTPHFPGAEELVKVRGKLPGIVGETTTYWRLVPGGGFVQVNIRGEVIMPPLSGRARKYGFTAPTGETYDPERLTLIAEELTEFSKLEGKAQFDEAIKIGLIPEGSKYVAPLPKPKVVGEPAPSETWSYIPPGQVKIIEKFEADLPNQPQNLQDAYKRGGFKGYNRVIKKLQAEFEAAFKALKAYTMPLRFDDKAIKVGIQDYHRWTGKKITPQEFREALKDMGGYDIINIINDVKSGKLNVKYPNAIWGAKEFAEMTKKVEHDLKILENLAEIQNNLPLALARGIVTSDDLLRVGFKKKDVDEAVETVEVAKSTGVAVAGDRNWYVFETGETISDEERVVALAEYDKKIEEQRVKHHGLIVDWEALGPNPRVGTRLTGPSGRRMGIELTAVVLPPMKAAKPEYTIKDISVVEWGLAAVNVALIGVAFAPGAIMGSLGGRAAITGVSATGAGLISYEVKKNWADLTPTQRKLGVAAAVLYALPMLITIARGVKISVAKPIPTAKGQIPTWRGLSVGGHPIIGRSGGRFVIGARNITLPEVRLILDGYKPEMMLETKVFVNANALKTAGLSRTQIDYLIKTLKARGLFAGQKSPFLAKEVLLEPTQRLSADEISVLLRQINKYNKQVKQVDMLYGSATIKPQLAPKLRGWRAIHDWDIATNMSPEKAAVFSKEILKELRALPGSRQYRISPGTPTLVEKKIGGKWVHIADIHSHEVTPYLGSEEIPASKLDVTGDYSYGRLVAEPAITVKYPGVGKFDIMRLSESGVRKADTILRIRQTELGTKLLPPARGMASPGVPKDAADFYVILRTFKGQGIADEWLKSWVKAMGYTPKELARVLPMIREAALKVASETPSSLIGYRLYPASQAKVPPGASPAITLHIPSSLGASVAASSSLGRQILSPISPYTVSPSARSIISASVSSLVPLSSKGVISPEASPKLLSVAPSSGVVSLHPSLP